MGPSAGEDPRFFYGHPPPDSPLFQLVGPLGPLLLSTYLSVSLMWVRLFFFALGWFFRFWFSLCANEDSWWLFPFLSSD